jgi:ABC-2 type transport system permease protein
MLYYAWTEALRTLRNRRYTIFVVLFPVALYLINANIYGGQTAAGGVRQSVYLMVQMAGYGALGASMMSSAVPWAQERRSGWLRQLQITPLPGWAIVATKLAIALLLVLPSLVLVFAVAVLQQGVSMPLGRWAALAAVMWLGAIPFVALGLAIGSLLSPESAQPAAADGASIGDIARRLHLSEGTVRNYLSSAIHKTHARNRIEAVRRAQAHGWLHSGVT